MKKIVVIALCLLVNAPITAMRPQSHEETSSEERSGEINNNHSRSRSSSGGALPRPLRRSSSGNTRAAQPIEHCQTGQENLPPASPTKSKKPPITPRTKLRMLKVAGTPFASLNQEMIAFIALNYVILNANENRTQEEEIMRQYFAKRLDSQWHTNPSQTGAALEDAQIRFKNGLYESSTATATGVQLYKPIIFLDELLQWAEKQDDIKKDDPSNPNNAPR